MMVTSPNTPARRLMRRAGCFVLALVALGSIARGMSKYAPSYGFILDMGQIEGGNRGVTWHGFREGFLLPYVWAGPTLAAYRADYPLVSYEYHVRTASGPWRTEQVKPWMETLFPLGFSFIPYQNGDIGDFWYDWRIQIDCYVHQPGQLFLHFDPYADPYASWEDTLTSLGHAWFWDASITFGPRLLFSLKLGYTRITRNEVHLSLANGEGEEYWLPPYSSSKFYCGITLFFGWECVKDAGIVPVFRLPLEIVGDRVLAIRAAQAKTTLQAEFARASDANRVSEWESFLAWYGKQDYRCFAQVKDFPSATFASIAWEQLKRLRFDIALQSSSRDTLRRFVSLYSDDSLGPIVQMRLDSLNYLQAVSLGTIPAVHEALYSCRSDKYRRLVQSLADSLDFPAMLNSRSAADIEKWVDRQPRGERRTAVLVRLDSLRYREAVRTRNPRVYSTFLRTYGLNTQAEHQRYVQTELAALGVAVTPSPPRPSLEDVRKAVAEATRRDTSAYMAMWQFVDRGGDDYDINVEEIDPMDEVTNTYPVTADLKVIFRHTYGGAGLTFFPGDVVSLGYRHYALYRNSEGTWGAVICKDN